MPIVPNFIERQLFLTLNMGPAPMLDIFNALNFRMVLAAVRLGIFDALAEKPATPTDLAPQLNIHPEALTKFLAALDVLGYVEQKDHRYQLTRMSKKWLTGDENNLAPYYRFWGTNLFELWDHFEQTLQNGQNDLNLYEWIEDQPQTSQDFQEGMIQLAKMSVGEVTKKLIFPEGTQRLLDVGGGHGMYTVALCEKYPNLQATIWDSPQALATGRAKVAKAGMESRIQFREGNFMTDDPEPDYDALMLFNIVHGFDAEGNQTLFKRMHSALKPGGLLLITEQLIDGGGSPTLKAAVHLLGMAYYHLLGGQIYSFAEIESMLGASGYRNVQRHNLLRSGSALITAERV